MSDWLDRRYSGEVTRGEFGKRTKGYNTDGTRTNYVGMSGRVSVAELLQWLKENAPDTPLADVHVNYVTVVWADKATPAELEAVARREAKRAENLEKWERTTLAKLKEKYE